MNLEMKLEDIMKKDPIIVNPDDSLEKVSKKMARQNKDVIVVQEEGVVQGLVTAGNIYQAMRSYVLGKYILESTQREIRDVKVKELMMKPLVSEFMEACGLTESKMCITLSKDNSVADAMRVMAISGIDHILITNANSPVGTISETDLLKAFE